jgi:hypothetical protein
MGLPPSLSNKTFFSPDAKKTEGSDDDGSGVKTLKPLLKLEKFFCLMKKCANGCHFISFYCESKEEGKCRRGSSKNKRE